MNDPNPHTGRALLAGVTAYLVWGVVGLYFHALAPIPPLTILAHRVVWSLVFCCVVMGFTINASDFRHQVRNIHWKSAQKLALILLASSVCISVNWVTFIIASVHDKLVAASLGYFLAPLMNVIMGVLLLRERLRAMQAVSILIAAGAVLAMVLGNAQDLWVSILIVISWSLYAYLRKIAHIGPIVGLTVETALLLPLAIGYLIYNAFSGTTVAPISWAKYGMLIFAGILTAIPLMIFVYATRRLRLTTIGLLQFIAPTVQFLVATLILHQPVNSTTLACFCVIWSALALYCIDAYRATQTVLVNEPD